MKEYEAIRFGVLDPVEGGVSLQNFSESETLCNLSDYGLTDEDAIWLAVRHYCQTHGGHMLVGPAYSPDMVDDNQVWASKESQPDHSIYTKTIIRYTITFQVPDDTDISEFYQKVAKHGFYRTLIKCDGIATKIKFQRVKCTGFSNDKNRYTGRGISEWVLPRVDITSFEYDVLSESVIDLT